MIRSERVYVEYGAGVEAEVGMGGIQWRVADTISGVQQKVCVLLLRVTSVFNRSNPFKSESEEQNNELNNR